MTREQLFAKARRQIRLYAEAGYDTPEALRWAEGTPCPVCREQVTTCPRGGPCDRCFGLVQEK